MQSKPCENRQRTTVVCVDTYDDRVLAGRLYDSSGGSGNFQSLIELLAKMETRLNELRCPQPFAAIRSFALSCEQPADPPPEGKAQVGRRGTFAVRVLFWQNASWQGSVTWLEGDKEVHFRSVLELVMLMDSALNGTELSTAACSSA